jgi:hypothetical protein
MVNRWIANQDPWKIGREVSHMKRHSKDGGPLSVVIFGTAQKIVMLGLR